MNKLYNILLISALMISLFACNDEESLRDESVVVVQKLQQNELDEWIYENLTVPYNVKVKYKWDDGEVENKFHVVPPKVEKAKEFLEAYLNIWIKSYEAEAVAGGNPDYLKKYMPKLLILVGTPQYNDDGTRTLGLAEGGTKVSIFNINEFANVLINSWDTPEEIAQKKRNAVTTSFHTLHHEFAHIMHQTKFYSNDFKEVCKGSYTGNWKDVSVLEARKKGFITPYSMLNENEDFVEIVAGMLDKVKYSNEPFGWKNTTLKDENGDLTSEKDIVYMSEWEGFLYTWGWETKYENWVPYDYLSPEAKEGYEKFSAKVEFVTRYYKENWSIDLYSLQKRIETAINSLYTIDN